MEKNDFKLFGVLFFLVSYKIFLSARTTKENYKVLPFAVLMMYIASKSYNYLARTITKQITHDRCRTKDARSGVWHARCRNQFFPSYNYFGCVQWSNYHPCVYSMSNTRERERERAERGICATGHDLAGSPSTFPVLHSPSPIPQSLFHAKHLSEQAIIGMTGHWGKWWEERGVSCTKWWVDQWSNLPAAAAFRYDGNS